MTCEGVLFTIFESLHISQVGSLGQWSSKLCFPFGAFDRRSFGRGGFGGSVDHFQRTWTLVPPDFP